jgi:phage repressor protein C with HTH and peptisase S24 domain
MVLVDLTQRSPSPPGVMALFDGIGIVIKRVALVPGVQPAAVRVKSDNSQYEFYEQELEEVDIIGRVLWYSREL